MTSESVPMLGRALPGASLFPIPPDGSDRIT
jgi:hypothetical protein